MAIQTFELVSPFLTIYAPSKKWGGASSLLLGQTSTRLVAGELLSLTGANAVERPEFVIDDTANLALTKFVAPYFSETGRGDIVTSGSLPILQFGPFEADTMLFERSGDDEFADGEGSGALSNGPIIGAGNIGDRVFAMPVRNPLNGDTFNSSNYVIGVGTSVGSITDSFCVGRVSRITGSGASAKVRILFGVN